jgi:hypothetical protein
VKGINADIKVDATDLTRFPRGEAMTALPILYERPTSKTDGLQAVVGRLSDYRYQVLLPSVSTNIPHSIDKMKYVNLGKSGLKVGPSTIETVTTADRVRSRRSFSDVCLMESSDLQTSGHGSWRRRRR